MITCLFVAFAAGAEKAQLATRFNSDSIVISGVTPSGSAAVVIVSRSLEGYFENVAKISNSFADDDGDGAVSIPMPNGVPPRTVVVAVDERTGDYIVSTPAEPSHKQVQAGAFKRDRDGKAIALRRSALATDLVVVRPGAGSWFSYANSTVHVNEDGTQEAGVILSFDGVKGRDPAPKTLTAGDVCIAIDEETLEAVVLKEGK